ncbi:MAG: DEAD/DEAH box helicase [Deltaproteobacteria bacterium]|nr:DEAD/DEAH box helicase [Deltaproteobacteria bacterium]
MSDTWLPSLRDELTHFSRSSRVRGQQYATAARVLALQVEESTIRAQVRGTDVYEVRWDWSDGVWEATCSCPVGWECKHCYAVATVVLQAHARSAVARAASSLADFRVAGLPATSVPREPFAVPSTAARRRAADPGSRAVDILRSAIETWDRHQALITLLRSAPRRDLAYLPVMHDALGEPEPELRCWRVATLVTELADGWLPPALEEYRSRPDLADALAEREREARIGRLLRWADGRRSTGERRLRVLLGLTRDAFGVTRVTAEARLTTARLADVPRSFQQLQQLRSDVLRGSASLPPVALTLLELLVTQQGTGVYSPGTALPLTGTALHSLALHASGGEAPLVTWGETLPLELAARAGVTPGMPLRLAADPARIVLTCRAQDDDAWLRLSVTWPDGRSRDLADALRLAGRPAYGAHEPVLVLTDGMLSLVAEDAPADVLDQFERGGGVLLPRHGRAAVLTRLAARFPDLSAALAPRTRRHVVVPTVTLDLRDDDWLQVRLFAHGGTEPCRPDDPEEARVRFEYVPEHGWMTAAASSGPTGTEPMLADGSDTASTPRIETDAAVTPDADVPQASTVPTSSPAASAPAASAAFDDTEALIDPWLELPDPATVAPALEWLARLPVTTGTRRGPGGHEPLHADRATGWWMQVSKRAVVILADAWEQHPTSVQYFGTERVRRLLLRSGRVVPRLRIATSGIDWLAVSAEWQAEGLALDDADLAALRAATTPFVRLRSGWVRRDEAAGHDEAAVVLADLGLEPASEPQRLSLWQLAGARPETLAALEHMGADAATLETIAELRRRIAAFTGLPKVRLSRRVKASLRPYQQRGLEFLAYTSSLGLGAVLADDMGLGKTVQALAWLEHLRAAAPDAGPSLVVCPASVLHNWAREAARFVPGLRVLVLGSGASRHALRRELPDCDLALTTYALLRRDLEAWRAVALRALVLDEAQTIKNPDAIASRAACALEARHRLALTGTPLENRALDLWSIVQFANPGYLGTRAEFSRRYDRLDAPAHARALLAAKLRPVLLRRMKRDVADDLPERIEERRDCEMTRGQRQLYLAELARSRRLVERLSDAPDGLRRNKIAILAALTRLRQVCCHPALAGGKSTLGSGKFEALAELLEPLLEEGHKVLLFSQFVQCLKLLRTDLQRRDVPTHLLIGQTTKREHVVQAFTDDPRACVFLISLKAGGLGLNLTSASHVVLFDPWWNPAVEAQAIDRTHRIGQDRTVIAFRLLTAGTIEEKIFELQQRKAALARDVLGEDGFARSLSREDLGYLLTET